MPWAHDRPHGGFTEGRPWLPVTAAHLARAVDLQAGDPGSMLETTRRLLAWRRDRPALVRGAIRVLPMPDGLLAIERALDGEAVRAVFNLTDAPRALPPLEAGFTEARLEGLPTASRGVLPPYGIALGERAPETVAIRSVPTAIG
jgi:alpha-glucosidase